MMLPITTRYKMIWGGRWRPVTWMGDENNKQTFDRRDARSATLLIAERGGFAPVSLGPADLVLNEGPRVKQWINHSPK